MADKETSGEESAGKLSEADVKKIAMESPEFKEALAKVSRESALLDAVNGGELPTAESIEMISKAFTKMILADERGEEPDFSEFTTPPVPNVDSAVENYAANEKNPGDNLLKRLAAVKLLFKPHPSSFKKENLGYRFLARATPAKMKESNVSFAAFFTDYRDYKDNLHGESIEKLMRDVDAEMRGLDQIVRDEINYNFVDMILTPDNTSEIRGWAIATTPAFTALSEKARKAISNLMLFYFHAKVHHHMYRKGYKTVNRDFDQKEIKSVIATYSRGGEVPDRIDVSSSFFGGNYGSGRTISTREYKDLLILAKALYKALPDSFRDTVEAAMWLEAPRSPDPTSNFENPKLQDTSRYLRNAFIAISQGRGLFESFATALLNYYKLLDEDLNHKVSIANQMVGLYDSLDLDISDTLNGSLQRITEELPF